MLANRHGKSGREGNTMADRLEIVKEGTFRVPEAQKFSGLGRSLLYSLMNTGALRYAKVGRCRLIPKEALMKLLADRLVG